jgi:biopolymer transport protein ExbD
MIKQPGWFDYLIRRLIEGAAGHAPTTLAERLREEWLADLRERSEPLARLGFALSCFWAAFMITHEGSTGVALPSAAAVAAPIGMAPGGHGRSLYKHNELAAEAPAICDINTTPLIDVLLVLLITLILSLPLLNHAVKIDLPHGITPQQISPPEVIDLAIDFDGAVEWNGTLVADSRQLEGYLRTQARKEPQPEIHIRPNARVRYDFVAKVLAAVQRNGMRKVGFVNTVELAQ